MRIPLCTIIFIALQIPGTSELHWMISSKKLAKSFVDWLVDWLVGCFSHSSFVRMMVNHVFWFSLVFLCRYVHITVSHLKSVAGHMYIYINVHQGPGRDVGCQWVLREAWAAEELRCGHARSSCFSPTWEPLPCTGKWCWAPVVTALHSVCGVLKS